MEGFYFAENKPKVKRLKLLNKKPRTTKNRVNEKRLTFGG